MRSRRRPGSRTENTEWGTRDEGFLYVSSFLKKMSGKRNLFFSNFELLMTLEVLADLQDFCNQVLIGSKDRLIGRSYKVVQQFWPFGKISFSAARRLTQQWRRLKINLKQNWPVGKAMERPLRFWVGQWVQGQRHIGSQRPELQKPQGKRCCFWCFWKDTRAK